MKMYHITLRKETGCGIARGYLGWVRYLLRQLGAPILRHMQFPGKWSLLGELWVPPGLVRTERQPVEPPEVVEIWFAE
jgi:hypothetical protein